LDQVLEKGAVQAEVKSAMLKAGAEPVWANSQSMAVFMQADMVQ